MHGRAFFTGLLAGGFATLTGGTTLLYLLSRFELVRLEYAQFGSPGQWFDWLYSNLGLSIPVFAALLLAYFVTLRRLGRLLEVDDVGQREVNRIVQLDHLADIWTTLFFGTGVIWTAIGMRSALLYALGDRQRAVAEGAFAMLERMIDGGILLALSTTIFGGIGGYLMRIYKTVTLGARLQQTYDHAARADTSQMRESLQRIEARLGRVGGDDGAEP